MALNAMDLRYNPRCMDAAGCLVESRGFVEDAKVRRCGGLPEHWTSNAFLDTRKIAGYPGPVSVQNYRRNEPPGLTALLDDNPLVPVKIGESIISNFSKAGEQ